MGQAVPPISSCGEMTRNSSRLGAGEAPRAGAGCGWNLGGCILSTVAMAGGVRMRGLGAVPSPLCYPVPFWTGEVPVATPLPHPGTEGGTWVSCPPTHHLHHRRTARQADTPARPGHCLCRAPRRRLARSWSAKSSASISLRKIQVHHRRQQANAGKGECGGPGVPGPPTGIWAPTLPPQPSPQFTALLFV